MSIAVGIFDLFTYTVPGALYLGLLGYLGARLGWLDSSVVTGTPSLLLVAVAILVSYLLGYLAYPLGALTDRAVPRRRVRDSRAEFLRRTPAAVNRPYVQAYPFLLVCAIQLHDKDAAADVTRLRAAGLMLRNSAPPLLIGAVAAVIELFVGRPAVAAVSGVVLCGIAVGLSTQARRLSHWATIKTLELCFWLPDIDAQFSVGPAPGQ